MSKQDNSLIKTLYQTCLKYFAENLLLFCDITDDQLYFKDKNFKLNNTISEDFVEKLSELNKINDLNFSLLTSKQTCLKKIKIKTANLKKTSLKILQQHNIHELTINQLTTSPILFDDGLESEEVIVTINNIIDSFNNETKLNLRVLDLSHNNMLFTRDITNFTNLKSLVKLNVSYTYFNNLSLDIITREVENLEYLDISSTRVCNLEALLRVKTKLKHLLMYNLRFSLNSDMIIIIGCLNNLIQLDLSKDLPTQLFADLNHNKFDINKFLTETKDSFRNLQMLDISAQPDINEDLLL
jgi:hypothetical protein